MLIILSTVQNKQFHITYDYLYSTRQNKNKILSPFFLFALSLFCKSTVLGLSCLPSWLGWHLFSLFFDSLLCFSTSFCLLPCLLPGLLNADPKTSRWHALSPEFKPAKFGRRMAHCLRFLFLITYLHLLTFALTCLYDRIIWPSLGGPSEGDADSLSSWVTGSNAGHYLLLDLLLRAW